MKVKILGKSLSKNKKYFANKTLRKFYKNQVCGKYKKEGFSKSFSKTGGFLK